MSDNVTNLDEKRATMRALEGVRAKSGIAGGGSGPHDPIMDARVTALEAAVMDMRVMLGRIDERTAALATKEDVANVRTDLASKAGRGTVWAAGITLLGLVTAAGALGAVYMPYLAVLLHRAGG